MDIKKQFTTVTTFSKIVALVVFIVPPFFGFWLGIQYQKSLPEVLPNLINGIPAPSVRVKQEQSSSPCDDIMNQNGLNECSYKELAISDDRLKKLVSLLIKTPDLSGENDHEENTKRINQLKKAQNLWEQYRDTECNYESRGFWEGTAYPMVYYGCKEKLAEERISELLKMQEYVSGELSKEFDEFKQ